MAGVLRGGSRVRRDADPTHELACDGSEVEGVAVDAQLDARSDDERADDESAKRWIHAGPKSPRGRERFEEQLQSAVPSFVNGAEGGARLGVSLTAGAELFENDGEVWRLLKDAPGVREVRLERVVRRTAGPAVARVELAAGMFDEGED